MSWYLSKFRILVRVPRQHFDLFISLVSSKILSAATTVALENPVKVQMVSIDTIVSPRLIFIP